MKHTRHHAQSLRWAVPGAIALALPYGYAVGLVASDGAASAAGVASNV